MQDVQRKIIHRVKVSFVNFDQAAMLRYLVVFSAFVHIIAFTIGSISLFYSYEPLIDEWSIDTEVLSDEDFESSKSSLEDSEKAEKAEVPSNLLPQLTKNFSVDEAKAADEDGLAEKQDEKSETDGKAKEKTKLKTESKDNKLSEAEIRKRQALEMLRKVSKDSKTKKAPTKDELAAIAEKYQKNKKGGGSSSLSMGLGKKRYRTKVYKHISRNYFLPEAYNFTNMKMNVHVIISINKKGFLTTSKITKSSGDKVFDDIVFRAVKNSVPFPVPPDDVVGKIVKLNFSPSSF